MKLLTELAHYIAPIGSQDTGSFRPERPWQPLGTLLRRWWLRSVGNRTMRYYMARVEAVTDLPFTVGSALLAESMCPSLRLLRRRAKACAKLIKRLE